MNSVRDRVGGEILVFVIRDRGSCSRGPARSSRSTALLRSNRLGFRTRTGTCTFREFSKRRNVFGYNHGPMY
jgi:hypothetical protein